VALTRASCRICWAEPGCFPQHSRATAIKSKSGTSTWLRPTITWLGFDSIRLNQGPKVHYTRPAADPLFISAAEAHGKRVMGVVLSGGNSDGAAGLRAIAEHGGTALVQDPKEAAMPYMPRAAIAADHPDACLKVEEIAKRIRSFCAGGTVV
jgi:chemotaxis response regulator CheB